MRYSPDGRHLLGSVGAGRIYIDGQVPDALENLSAGGWDWTSETVVTGPGGYGTPQVGLYAYDIETWELTYLDQGQPPRLASTFYANGNGHWVAYLASASPFSYDDHGRIWNGRAALGYVGSDIILTDAATYQPLYIVHYDGTETVIPNPGLWESVAGEYFSRAYQGCYFGARAPENWYACGYLPEANGLCVWRPFAPHTPVWVLSTQPDDFNPDIAEYPPDEMLVVGTGQNQGETAQHDYELDLQNDRYRKDGGRWMPLATIPPTPPPVIPPIGPFNHPVVVVPFKDPEGTSGGPMEVLVNLNDQKVNRPYFVGLDTVSTHTLGALQGIYDETPDMQRAMAIAQARGTRCVYSHDAMGEVTIPNNFRPCDQIWMELYRYPNESLEQAKTRWFQLMELLLHVWPNDIGVIPMFYRMGSVPGLWSEQQALDTIAYLTDIVNMDRRIKVIAPFSYQRANGIVANAGLREALSRLLQAGAEAGMPTFMPVVPIPPIPPDPPVPPDPPHPPIPPPEDNMVYIGQKIRVRDFDSTDPTRWFNAVVVTHQDATRLDPPHDPKQPPTIIYAISRNFPTGVGSYASFKGAEAGADAGTPNGVTQNPPGAAERVTFSANGNIMSARPNCGWDGSGVSREYTVVVLG